MAYTYKVDQTFVHRSKTHEFTIRWTRIGNPDGPPLIFVHGTPWSNIVWHNLASCLASRYSIYLYDHPGFGDSPSFTRLDGVPEDKKDDLDGPLIHRAEASAALFKHWNLTSPPHVVAHDNAGLVSLRLLLQHNIEFASLCLASVVVIGPFGLPLFKVVAENHDVFTAIPPNMVEGFVRAYVNGASYKGLTREVEDMLCTPWFADGKQGPERFLQEMIQAHNRNNDDVVGEYASAGNRVPIKIIWGKEDYWLPVDLAGKLKTALNAKEMVLVDEASHLIHYDQPSIFAVEVALWLEQNTR